MEEYVKPCPSLYTGKKRLFQLECKRFQEMPNAAYMTLKAMLPQLLRLKHKVFVH
jgi:hypothetical protein